MDSNAVIDPESPPLLRIRCSEIWGGPENADLDVCTSGVIASVFSLSCDGLTGGDLYYFAVCDSDLLTRVVLADLKRPRPSSQHFGRMALQCSSREHGLPRRQFHSH